MKSVEEQIALIERGTVDFHSRDDLVKKLTRSLETGVPLTIKAGFDPTVCIIVSNGADFSVENKAQEGAAEFLELRSRASKRYEFAGADRREIRRV